MHAWYRCPSCGDFFDLSQLNVSRHPPSDVARMAVWLLKAVAPPEARFPALPALEIASHLLTPLMGEYEHAASNNDPPPLLSQPE